MILKSLFTMYHFVKIETRKVMQKKKTNGFYIIRFLLANFHKFYIILYKLVLPHDLKLLLSFVRHTLYGRNAPKI